MDTFTITIVDRKPVQTAGLMVVTSMEKASIDCPNLWRTGFGPRIASFPADPNYPGESYGVSIMDQGTDGAFSYWAVMPVQEGTAIPDDMSPLTIPGGVYASCDIPSLAQLGAAFTYIYTEWPKSQSAYRVDMTSPCLEFYQTSTFLATGGLTVQCPLITA